jgi:hypothetical protein
MRQREDLSTDEEPEEHDWDHLTGFAQSLGGVGDVFECLIREEHGTNITDSHNSITRHRGRVLCGSKNQHLQTSDESVGEALDEKKEEGSLKLFTRG